MEREFEPPAIVQQEEETTEQLMASIKETCESVVKAGNEWIRWRGRIGTMLLRLRKRASHGQWEVWLKELGIPDNSARRWMKKAGEPCQMSQLVHLDDAVNDRSADTSEVPPLQKEPDRQRVCHRHWKLGHKEPKKGCPDCKAMTTGHRPLEFDPPLPEPEPEPETASPEQEPPLPSSGRNGKRKAGEDPVEPLDRAKKIIEKEIDEAATLRQVSAAIIAGLKQKVGALVSAIQDLWKAPKKTMPPIKKNCRSCGVPIVLARTAKGKVVAFDAGKGRFELVDDVMVYQKNGGSYRPHLLTCTARKKP